MKLFRTAFLWLLVFSLFASGCELRSRQTIKIGIIAYLKGNGDTTNISGMPTINAARLFEQQVNNLGGARFAGQSYLVELVVEAIENDPSQAEQAMRALVEKGVVAVVGPQYSGDAVVAGNVAEDAKIPLISGTATSPQVTENHNFVFRIGFSDTAQAAALAAFASHDLNKSRVAVLYDNTDTYSNGIARRFEIEFEALGGDVVAMVASTAGNQDLATQVAAIVEAAPEMIFIPTNYPADVIFQAGQLRKAGFTGTLLGSDGWDAPTLVKLPAFDGSYSTATYSPVVTTPQNRIFIKSYQEIYGITPNDAAGTTYDALGLIIAAIEHKQSFNPQAIRDGLMELSRYEGISGVIDYVENGDPVKPIMLLYFNEGVLEFYKAFQP